MCRLELLANLGKSDTELRDRRLHDRRERADASIRCSDLELPQASRRGMCKVTALTNRCSFLSEASSVTVRGRTILNGTNESQVANALRRIAVEEEISVWTLALLVV